MTNVDALFIIGMWLIGYLFPEWLLMFSHNKGSVGYTHNFICATGFALITFWFIGK